MPRRIYSVLMPACLLGAALLAHAGISPSALEVNMASFPVDSYPTTSSGGGATNNGIFPSCPSTYTMRQCVQYFFNNNPSYGTVNPENYVAQGVVGVRFFYALGGGGGNPNGSSTPFVLGGGGSLSTTWSQSLYQFFSDLHKYGIQYVTPNPVMTGIWSATSAWYQTKSVSSCGTNKSLTFLPWLPFGLDPASSYFPADSFNNQAYSCSATNTTNFWTWAPFFNLMYEVFAQAKQAGLTIREVDLDNEIDLEFFTVSARLIYDNTTGTAVVDSVGTLLSAYGFSRTGATISVGIKKLPYSLGVGYDCGSTYGDSAFLDPTSQLLAAFGGGKLGLEPYTTLTKTDLPCYDSTSICGPPNGSQTWQTCATQGMISLPGTQRVPTVQDLHAQPCLISGTYPPGNWGNCVDTDDTTTFAKDLYSDFWSFLSYRSLTGSLAMIGETTSNQPDGGGTTACEYYLQKNATQNLNGYKASTLYSSDAANVVLRPWENSRALLYPSIPGCYVVPAPIGKGYGPYDPTTR